MSTKPRKNPDTLGDAANQTPPFSRADEKPGVSTDRAPETDEPNTSPFPIVAIGASAGGLAALKTFFSLVPKESGAAYVVVVHLSPEHESHLQEILRPICAIPVHQVTQTVRLERNRVYIIPPNSNLDAIDTHLRLSDLERHRQNRAPIDHFFRTLAEMHGRNAIGVILSGTGSDGSLGLRRIKECGGLTVVQTPSEAEYGDMPRNAIKAVPVDLVVPVGKIPHAVLHDVARSEPKACVTSNGDDTAENIPEDTPENDKQFLKKIFAIVQSRTGRDFNQYKLSTMYRRVVRRMQFHRLPEPSAYLDLLQRSPEESSALADDLLINVTSFFRDPEVFEALENTVVDRLFAGKGPTDSVRIWSVGCATGEEAYSLAILLLEKKLQLDAPPMIQMFASDLHKQSLDRAREGFYPTEALQSVRPDRLERFFDRENGGYRVKAALRELVVFAPHNLIADPPYSRLDMISCRNLFIYLDRELHQRIVEIFHYALKPDGHLLLGISESIDEGELFRIEDKKRSIFRRNNAAVFEPRLPVFNLGRSRTSDRLAGVNHHPTVAYGGIHQRMVEQYAPPSVLLSPDNHVVHFSAHAGRYFVHPGGTPTTSVFKLVRDDLRVELKAAVSAARVQGGIVRTRPIHVRFNGHQLPVSLDVRPSLDPEQQGFLLVIFDENPLSPTAVEMTNGDTPSRRDRDKVNALMRAKESAEQRLQGIIKEYETTQEDLRASNEELQSANEELRSTFEELETSKEELQSINEELQTVNQENRHKVEELAQLSSDLQNLFMATDIATIFLDRDFRILRFTPSTTDLFNVRMTDRGRPLSDLTHRLGHAALEDAVLYVLEQLIPIEREVEDSSGRWYLMRIRPYRTMGDRIAGVVLTFVEITQRKHMEDALRRQKEFSEHIIETLPQPLLVLSDDFIVERANAAFYTHFNVRRDETQGRKIYDLGNGQWNIPSLRELLERVLPDNTVFNGYEVDHVFDGLGHRVMLLNGRKLRDMRLILLGISDITERSQVEKAVRANNERLRLQRMINVRGVGVINFDRTGVLIDANDAFLQMTGRTRDEVTRRTLTWQNMTAPEHRETSEHQLEQLHAAGRIGPYEKECLRKDGSRLWMVFAGADLGDGTSVEYCMDVSDRKRAEAALHEAQARLAADLEAMSTLQRLGSLFIAEGNLNSILHEIIDAAVAITGADFGTIQILDAKMKRLKLVAQRGFEPGWVDFCSKIEDGDGGCRRVLDLGERVIVEDVDTDSYFAGMQLLELHRQAGVRAFQVTPLVSRSGRPLGVFSTHTQEAGRPVERTLKLLDLLARQASDIIDRAQGEEAREVHHRLVEADRRKNEFLAMLSHELRNPLTPIRTSLHILDLAAPGSEKARRAQAVISRQVDHMTHLIEDLLDITRITSGKIQLECEILDLNELVQRVMTDHREVFVAQGVALEMLNGAHDVWVNGDRTRLSQVIGNILQNAAKFTAAGGKTSISVRSNLAHEQAIVRIADTGRGIPPEILPKLFEPFTQADVSLDRSKGGLGLGLSVVKGLVELHGGSVWGESDGQGKGAVFTIALPLVMEPATFSATQQQTRGPRRRVLVVEDNADAADSLRTALEFEGHDVEVAHTGREGLAKASTFVPDFVFCDIGLPELNGYEVATAMRADPKLAQTVLIALTGYATPEDVAKTKAAGFDEHLAKPPSLAAILTVMNEKRR